MSKVQVNEKINDNNILELEEEYLRVAVCRECIDIISEELDYHFHCKEKALGFLIESIDLKKVNEKVLAEKANRLLGPSTDLALLLSKVERRVLKELVKIELNSPLKFNRTNCKNHSLCPLVTSEELRTLKITGLVNKGIDMVWKKTGSSFVPKEMKKIVPKVKVGDYLLGTVGLNPKQVGNDLKNKIESRLRGLLKQTKVDLQKDLEDQILNHVLRNSGVKETTIIEKIIKTA